MSPRTVSKLCVVPAATFLLLIGALHGIVNVAVSQRATERGEIPARLTGVLLVNAALSGAALSMLGLILLLLLPGFRDGSRQAATIAAAIGIFVGVVGATGYLWAPAKPSSLIFLLIFLLCSALLAVPLLVLKRKFSSA